MKKKSSLLDMINPLYSFTARDGDYKSAPRGKWAMSKNPETNMALWNTVGVIGALAPTTALAVIAANEIKKRKLKKDLNDIAISGVNANMPILSPDADISSVDNIKIRPGKEVSEIDSNNLSLLKSASSSSLDPANLVSAPNSFIGSVALRSLPILAAPAAIYLAAAATNKVLKNKYAKELDEENTRLENMQDELDIKTLEDLGYIKKKASFIDSGIRKLFRAGGDALDLSKTTMVNLPLTIALGLLATGTAVSLPYFYKKSDSVRKIKEVKDHVLGTNKSMRSPELLIELPKGYEETGKRTAQVLPGISSSVDSYPAEDAIIEEKDKKDAFLG